MPSMSFHIPHRAIGGGRCIPWPLAPTVLKRWIWCDSESFDLYVNTVHTASEDHHLQYYQAKKESSAKAWNGV